MPHPWIPNSSPEIRKRMMEFLGISDIMELWSDVPGSLILREPPAVGRGRVLSEYEVVREMRRLASKNRVFRDPPPFIGGGVCYHYVPSLVKALASRAEFYTAYTPYQAEIAQGLLQAIFEYQSLMAELYGVDIVNASMYNGSTAAAEAVRMAVRVKRGRNRVLVAATAHPEIKEVIRTWVWGIGIKIEEFGDVSKGKVSAEDIKAKIGDDVAGVYVENPNFFGAIEDELRAIIEVAHEKGALAIVNADPILLGVLEAPGRLGADIVVGDAQPLGLGLNYGGPSAGIFGIKNDRALLRQLPGRLIGATRTEDGRDLGFAMILQTREQHIKRERATSNITTNSGLMAVMAAFYVSLLGATGLRKIGEAIAGRTAYALRRLKDAGIEAPALRARFLKQFPVRVGSDAEAVIKEALTHGVYVGPPLSRFFTNMRGECLVCVTEAHTREDIERLAEVLSQVGGDE